MAIQRPPIVFKNWSKDWFTATTALVAGSMPWLLHSVKPQTHQVDFQPPFVPKPQTVDLKTHIQQSPQRLLHSVKPPFGQSSLFNPAVAPRAVDLLTYLDPSEFWLFAGAAPAALPAGKSVLFYPSPPSQRAVDLLTNINPSENWLFFEKPIGKSAFEQQQAPKTRSVDLLTSIVPSEFWILSGAARNASADQSLTIAQAAADTVLVQSSAAQSLSIGEAAADTVLVQAPAAQSVTIGQSSLATVLVQAAAAQSLGVGEAVADTVLVQAPAAQSLIIGQVALAEVAAAINLSAAQSLGISQSVADTTLISLSAAQSLGISQAAAQFSAVSPDIYWPTVQREEEFRRGKEGRFKLGDHRWVGEWWKAELAARKSQQQPDEDKKAAAQEEERTRQRLISEAATLDQEAENLATTFSRAAEDNILSLAAERERQRLETEALAIKEFLDNRQRQIRAAMTVILLAA